VNATGITGARLLREPGRPAADPPGIVRAAGRELPACGIESRYGSEADAILAATAVDGGLPAPGFRPVISTGEPPAGSDGCVTAASRPGGGLCHWLQAFEDAIKFRHARASAPCSDCGTAPGRCDDHGRDLELITEYQRTARQLLRTAPQPLSSDTRVRAARDLLAEHHQPAAMPPGDLRALLARYQKRLHGLLDALGTSEPETGS